ncbi:MAG TPA: 30S ribosomal protein S13 [Candidatus Woesearchaeota archaeon]|nr:30S ribosomal protein S13 [Candidatus Woesearchaeota archaeon]
MDEKTTAQKTPENKGEKENFNYFVRVSNTDLDGKKQIYTALTKIKGVSFMFSNMVCNLAGIDKTSKVGYLSDEQVKKLDEVLTNLSKHDIPSWMLNRRKNYEDGKDHHAITGDLSYAIENDIKRMKGIRSYSGVRHGLKLPVRGQRTKSNFRKNKGNGSLGVKKKEGAKSGRT